MVLYSTLITTFSRYLGIRKSISQISSEECVLEETILTFEELTTLLTQIEGLLNSRPLSCVSDSNIECKSTLTPSIFLQVMFFLQYLRSFLQPPTKEIVGNCYRILNVAFGINGAPTFYLLYSLVSQ
ncbi:hypothetical protein TNCV_2461431 [Trichonephila clavipes]|nr:hypothetical protein TNCV_2461431 [Trichonephila clavipes]